MIPIDSRSACERATIHYYNETSPFAVAWLRDLIRAGHLPAGDVDDRDIRDVQASDVAGYTQCHWFSGIGGWAYAARLAGWPDDRPLWTGSCPCQPFSIAGKGIGAADDRHLWPDFFRLIRAARPLVVMGEQVTGKAGYRWFDGVRANLAGEDYASRCVDIPACAVDAPHIRNRLYWCAVRGGGDARKEVPLRVSQRRSSAGTGAAADLAHADVARLAVRESERRDNGRQRPPAERAYGRDREPSFWSGHEWIICHDGRARRAKPGTRLLVDGLPDRVDLWEGLGNAIVPELASEVIGAFMDCC